jgi:hypothetical protein
MPDIDKSHSEPGARGAGVEESAVALITRREAILRVSAILGGIALVGGSSLLTGCKDVGTNTDAPFTTDEIALLDEIADTILPPTSTPGAKAAQTGAFMALMVTDSYDAKDRKIFRDGLAELDRRSRDDNKAPFMSATPQQRLALLQKLDREQWNYSRSRENASRKAKGLKELPPEDRPAEEHLTDQRKELAAGSDVGAATAITADAPAHYFRMMKELALLGYFTSEIGCTQAQRFAETPGRFDPCIPYTAGEKSWAPHA